MDARKLIINSWLQYDITRSIAIHHVCEDMNPYIYCLKWFSSFMSFVYICLFKRSINVFTGKLILFFICWGGIIQYMPKIPALELFKLFEFSINIMIFNLGCPSSWEIFETYQYCYVDRDFEWEAAKVNVFINCQILSSEP